MPTGVKVSGEVYYNFVLVDPSSSNDVIAYLPNAHNARWAEAINEPSTLVFDLMADDANLSSVVRPNEVRLFDRNSLLLEQFRILRRTKVMEADGMNVYRVECESLLGAMAEETITFATAEIGADLDTILSAVLALQVGNNPVTYDAANIDTTIKNEVRAIDVKDETVLRTLIRLRDSIVNGFLGVDPATRKLTWTETTGENKGQRIEYRYNMKSVEEETDYGQLINRLHMRGRGEGDSAITLANHSRIPEIIWSLNSSNKDLSYNGLNLTDNGAAMTYDVLGTSPIGGNAILNGTDQYFNLESAIANGDEAHTIQLRFKSDVLPANGDANIETLFAESNQSDADVLYTVGLRTVAGVTKLRLTCVDEDAGTDLFEGTTTILVDTWYYVAIRNTGSQVAVWLDGVAEFADTSYTNATGSFSLTRTTVGGHKRGGDAAVGFFDGKICDVRVHDANLTDAQLLRDNTESGGSMDSVGSIAEFGIIGGTYFDRSITHPDTLYRTSVNFLGGRDVPLLSYKVGAADIAQVNLPEGNTTFHHLLIGSVVLVNHLDLGIDVQQTITRKVTNLDEPWDVRYEIQNRVRKLTDVVRGLFDTDQVEGLSNVTEIPVNQVKLGTGAGATLKLDDWVSVGVQTMNGAKITAGTVAGAAIGLLAVDTEHLAAEAVEEAKIKGSAVTPSKISVANLAQISNDAGTITNGNIGGGVIGFGTVDTARLPVDGVDGGGTTVRELGDVQVLYATGQGAVLGMLGSQASLDTGIADTSVQTSNFATFTRALAGSRYLRVRYAYRTLRTASGDSAPRTADFTITLRLNNSPTFTLLATLVSTTGIDISGVTSPTAIDFPSFDASQWFRITDVDLDDHGSAAPTAELLVQATCKANESNTSNKLTLFWEVDFITSVDVISE